MKITTRRQFSSDDIQAFSADAKIGLLATVDADGHPHITLITTLSARNDRELVFGQFCEGASKENVRQRPRVAFAVVDRQRRMWRGTATWKREARSGPEYDAYNQKPLFRYNAYFGIHTVHYLDLEEVEGPVALSVPRLVLGVAHAAVVRPLAKRSERERVLRPWAQELFDRMDALKFLAYRGSDGWPRLLPAVPCLAVGSSRLVMDHGEWGTELCSLPNGAPVGVLALSMKMESVLAQGALFPRCGLPGLRHGLVTITQVYNSMPPQQGLIYPRTPLRAVEVF